MRDLQSCASWAEVLAKVVVVAAQGSPRPTPRPRESRHRGSAATQSTAQQPQLASNGGQPRWAATGYNNFFGATRLSFVLMVSDRNRDIRSSTLVRVRQRGELRNFRAAGRARWVTSIASA